MNFSLLLASTLMLSASFSANAAAPKPWGEITHYALGGAGGWDLMSVDAEARHLFITRGEHLMVVDIDSGKVVGDVPGLKRAHGVALIPHKRLGYVSSGGDDQVVVFNLDTFKVVRQIHVTGKNPDALLFDESSGYVFSFNGGSNNASVIDPTKNEVIATMPVPGKPELAVSDGRGKIYFNIEDANQVAVADAKAARVLKTWSLGTCEGPTGLAIDTKNHRLFSVCDNQQMVVLDSNDGHLVASVPIGHGPDGAAFDAVTATAFSSNSDGTLTVVREDTPNHFTVAANVVTPARSRTIVLDPKMHHIILATAAFDAAPAPTSAQPHPRAPMKPESLGLLIVGQK